MDPLSNQSLKMPKPQPSRAFLRKQAETNRLKAGMMGVNLVSWPIRGIEYVIDKTIGAAIDAVCTSSDTASRVCEVGARGLERVGEAITPTSLLEFIEKGEVEIAVSFRENHNIYQRDTYYSLESAGKIGLYVVTMAVGGVAIKVGKSAVNALKKFGNQIKKSKANLPVIKGIHFDPKTAHSNLIAMDKKGYVQTVTVDGSNNSTLIFLEHFKRTTGSYDKTLERAFKQINSYMQEKGTENFFIQSLHFDKELFKAIRKQGYENIGKYPFHLKQFPVLPEGLPASHFKQLKRLKIETSELSKSARPDFEFSVLRVGRKSQLVALPAMAGSGAVMAYAGSAEGSTIDSSVSVVDSSGVDQASAAEIDSTIETLRASNEELIQLNGKMLESWVQQASRDTPQLAELQRNVNTDDSSQGGGSSKQDPPTRPLVDQQNYDQVCGRVHKDASNLAGIIGNFGDHSTGNNIALIANTSLAIATEVGGLIGLGAACTNPFSATLAIVNCVGMLINGFKKKKKKGVDPLQQQLQAIFSQLETIQKQLVELDQKSAEILDVCKEGFSTAFSTLQHHTWQLVQIDKKIVKLDQKVSAQFNQVSHSLQKILESLKNLERSQSLQDITSQLFLYLDEEQVDISRFKGRVEFLMRYARSISKQPNFNAADMSFTLRSRDYEFSIQTLFELCGIKSSSPLPNPSLFILGTLGILYLTIRQYPSINMKDFSKICSVDIKNLKSLLNEGRALQHSILDLNQSQSRFSVIQEYTEVSGKIISSLEEKLKSIEQERQYEINRTAHQLHLSNYRNPDLKASFDRNFEITITPEGTNWFKNGNDRVYASHGSVFNIPEQPEHTRIAINRHKTTINNGLKASKDRYFTYRLNSMSSVYQNAFNKADQIEMPWFILPKHDKNLPTLPIPSFIKDIIPGDFCLAAAKALGVFQIEYEISTENKFILNLDFKTSSNAQIIPVSQIEIDYNPRFYKGPEAVWLYWVGGNYPTNHHAAVIKFHHDNGSGTHDWLTRVPVLTSQEGMVDKVKLDQVKVIPCSDTYPELHELLAKHDLSEKKQKIQRLISEFSADNAELIQKFDEQYQKLVGFCALGYKDLLDNPDHRLHKALQDLFPFSHWSALSKSLRKINTNEPLITNSLLSFSNQLGSLKMFFLLLVSKDKTNDVMLDATLEILQFLIDYYEPHAVPWNRWNEAPASQEFRDSILTGSLETIGLLLNLAQKGGQVDSKEILSTIKKLHTKVKEEHQKLKPEDQQQSAEVFKTLVGGLGNLLTNGK